MAKHPDLEYHIELCNNAIKVTEDASEAFSLAVACAASDGKPHTVDVVCYSEKAAQEYGGDDAVEQYLEDPEASVFDRIVIRAESQGRIP